MSTVQELRERQALLQQLRDSGDPGALARAGSLQKTWHDEQMSLLSDDVYDAAMHTGMPPAGWIRLSELLAPRSTSSTRRFWTQATTAPAVRRVAGWNIRR